jgi:acyl carrier protein
MNIEQQLSEILEEEPLDLSRNLVDFDAWDSLAALSVIAALDADYGLNMTRSEIEDFPTTGDFVQYVKENGR